LRYQATEAARFRGGEGLAYLNDHIYFTTKYVNCVWSLNFRNNRLQVAYDAALIANPVLTGVDNITVSPDGTRLYYNS